MSMAMARVYIPCPHKNNENITPQQKVLDVKFRVINDPIAEFTIDPLCSACQGDIVVIAMAHGRTPQYCTAMQEDLLQIVREKIAEFQIADDEDYYADFLFEIHGRDDQYEFNRHGNEEVMMEMPMHDQMERTILEESFAAAAVRTIPATEEAIEALERIITPSSQEEEEENTSTCAICLEELMIKEDEVGTRLPCKHEFHENCIVEWLHTSHFCPLCRFQFPIA